MSNRAVAIALIAAVALLGAHASQGLRGPAEEMGFLSAFLEESLLSATGSTGAAEAATGAARDGMAGMVDLETFCGLCIADLATAGGCGKLGLGDSQMTRIPAACAECKPALEDHCKDWAKNAMGQTGGGGTDPVREFFCDMCVDEFAKAGGCENLGTEKADEKIPAGCGQCKYQFIDYCEDEDDTSYSGECCCPPPAPCNMECNCEKPNRIHLPNLPSPLSGAAPAPISPFIHISADKFTTAEQSGHHDQHSSVQIGVTTGR